MELDIGATSTPLDARFEAIRTRSACVLPNNPADCGWARRACAGSTTNTRVRTHRFAGRAVYFVNSVQRRQLPQSSFSVHPVFVCLNRRFVCVRRLCASGICVRPVCVCVRRLCACVCACVRVGQRDQHRQLCDRRHPRGMPRGHRYLELGHAACRLHLRARQLEARSPAHPPLHCAERSVGWIFPL